MALDCTPGAGRDRCRHTHPVRAALRDHLETARRCRDRWNNPVGFAAYCRRASLLWFQRETP